MGWIFDIAVVVLVIIAAVIGAKKGFFRACFDFCGALTGASLVFLIAFLHKKRRKASDAPR